jgi:membrane protease YdiL (CAAX protease family)
VGGVKDTTRLTLWAGLVALLSTLAYTQRATEGKPESDVLYHYSTAGGSAVGYAVILALTLAIAGRRVDLLALRRPAGWWRSLGLAAGTLLVVIVGGGFLDSILHAGEEQGYTPPTWEPSHAGAYAANFVVIAGVAPFVEELFFRGLGYSLLEPFGRWTAIVGVGLAFGLVHGLVAGLPLLALFGAALAWLRSRTGSVVPGMLVHASFNAFALIVAVTT